MTTWICDGLIATLTNNGNDISKHQTFGQFVHCSLTNKKHTILFHEYLRNSVVKRFMNLIDIKLIMQNSNDRECFLSALVIIQTKYAFI